MPSAPASVVVPTRARSSYLEVALASIAPQASALGAEVIVVDDAGDTQATRVIAERFGARYEPHRYPTGLNAARNTGVRSSSGELLVFVDDDVRVSAGWLQALLNAAREHPDLDVFTGPIRPRLEGPALRGCGREAPPVTSLELGPQDAKTRFAWGANMAIRRSAIERVGPFDTSLAQGGDEQDWQERLQRSGSGPVLYVARAALDHRREEADARLWPLTRAAYARGRGARRFDVHRGAAPGLAGEVRTLSACAGHVLRRRCPAGLVGVGHSAGRAREALREALHGPAVDLRRGSDEDTARMSPAAERAGGADAEDDFLSGASGTVGGLDALRREALDATWDAIEILGGQRLRLARAARAQPRCRRVLVLCVQRAANQRLAERARAELLRSRHEVSYHSRAAGTAGKFENLNRLLAEHSADGSDWLLVIDDDVELPRGFLDRFLFLCERFALQLAQPAHRLRSHAAWEQTRRRPRSVVRETGFVEIGPVTAFQRRTYAALLPFPDLRMGWGLDSHWAALARSRGWRCGVIDAVSIRHRAAPAASAYRREEAVAEARAFLAGRPYLSAQEARLTLKTHQRW